MNIKCLAFIKDYSENICLHCMKTYVNKLLIIWELDTAPIFGLNKYITHKGWIENSI